MLNRPLYINVGGKLLDLSVPKVMGILNVTPDSFYAGSRISNNSLLVKRASEMLNQGASILDVGGYSTRPGAGDISEADEADRVLNSIGILRKEFPAAIISVDTFRSGIAREAVLGYGADIINDISGGEADGAMFETVASLSVPYILMHMKGTPSTMQLKPEYDDVVSEILTWAGKKIYDLHVSGIKDIIFDPGFGFGKTTAHNFELLAHFSDLRITGLPLMAGLSRKSMIWKTLATRPEDSLNGTTVLNTIALLNGADILRVHDVAEAVEAVRLVKEIKINPMK